MKCEVKNKPNLPAGSGPGVEKRRCDYAKRTQFGGRPGSHTTKCAKRSQFAPRAQEWARAAGTGNLLRGPIVRNEANSRLHRVGRRPTDVVQTNPIWRDARCGLPPRACAGRLYKQTQFRRVATGLAVQTNPICPRRMGRRGRGWSLLRQTNPIARSGAPRRCRPWRPPGAPIIPVFHHSTIPVRCLSCKTKPIWGSSGFSVLVGCRPPSRGRCPRTPGICRFGPIAWQEDPEARLSCGADFRAALAATPGRPAGPSPSTPKELACPAVFIMLLAKSVKCRGLGRSPKRYRSTLKPDEPNLVRRRGVHDGRKMRNKPNSR
jgi:hypothetical protein